MGIGLRIAKSNIFGAGPLDDFDPPEADESATIPADKG